MPTALGGRSARCRFRGRVAVAVVLTLPSTATTGAPFPRLIRVNESFTAHVS
jgi:hypothetical protein